jgi:hypothetical protein
MIREGERGHSCCGSRVVRFLEVRVRDYVVLEFYLSVLLGDNFFGRFANRYFVGFEGRHLCCLN